MGISYCEGPSFLKQLARELEERDALRRQVLEDQKRRGIVKTLRSVFVTMVFRYVLWFFL